MRLMQTALITPLPKSTGLQSDRRKLLHVLAEPEEHSNLRATKELLGREDARSPAPSIPSPSFTLALGINGGPLGLPGTLRLAETDWKRLETNSLQGY